MTDTALSSPVSIDGAAGIALSPDAKHLYVGGKGAVTVVPLDSLRRCGVTRSWSAQMSRGR